MFREVMQCKPGKVRDLIAKFKALNVVLKRMGFPPFRLYTDASGAPFWTAVAESEADGLEAFMAMEEKVMADPEAQKAMDGYHDLVVSGGREIYRVVT